MKVFQIKIQNNMIAEIYIESAKNIRNEFLRLSKQLDSYQKNSADLVIYLEKKSKELQEYSDSKISKIRDKGDINKVGEYIMKELNEIEAEEQKLIRLVKPINDKIDRLKVDEANLFKQIKDKYPNLSENEIIHEIQSKI